LTWSCGAEGDEIREKGGEEDREDFISVECKDGVSSIRRV
jgi:hypothetical protein